MYMENTVYIVGNAKTNEDNAITIKFNSFYIGFVVDLGTDKIIDLNSSSTLRTTDEFIRSLLIGRNLRIFDDKLKENQRIKTAG